MSLAHNLPHSPDLPPLANLGSDNEDDGSHSDARGIQMMRFSPLTHISSDEQGGQVLLSPLTNEEAEGQLG